MIVIVGGQHRKIGKTALIEAILRGLPAAGWTAVKITTHHAPAGSEKPVRVLEETAPSPESDTGRYLAAGAARAYLVQCSENAVVDACEALRRSGILEGAVVIESGTAAEHLPADVFLLLVDADPRADAKPGFPLAIERAGAFVVTVPPGPGPACRLRLPPGPPRFFVRPWAFHSRPLIEFLRAKLRPGAFSRRQGEPPGQ